MRNYVTGKQINKLILAFCCGARIVDPPEGITDTCPTHTHTHTHTHTQHVSVSYTTQHKVISICECYTMILTVKLSNWSKSSTVYNIWGIQEDAVQASSLCNALRYDTRGIV